VVAAITGALPARTAIARTGRLQFDIGDAGSDIQAGLPCTLTGWQRIGILRPADQKVAAGRPRPTRWRRRTVIAARSPRPILLVGAFRASAVFKTKASQRPPSKYQMFDGEVI